MRIEAEFRHLLQELVSLDQKVRLVLPAQPPAIRLQKRQIIQARQALLELEETVVDRYGRGGIAAVRERYHHLMCYTQQIERRFSTLLLLAEEYLTDPEGTLACLRLVEQEHHHRMSSSLTSPPRSASSPPLTPGSASSSRQTPPSPFTAIVG